MEHHSVTGRKSGKNFGNAVVSLTDPNGSHMCATISHGKNRPIPATPEQRADRYRDNALGAPRRDVNNDSEIVAKP